MAEPTAEPPAAERRERRVDRATLVIGVVALVGLVWRVLYTWRLFRSDDNLFDEGDAFLYSFTATNTAKGHWYVNPFNGTHFADHPPLTVLSLVGLEGVTQPLLPKR